MQQQWHLKRWLSIFLLHSKLLLHKDFNSWLTSNYSKLQPSKHLGSNRHTPDSKLRDVTQDSSIQWCKTLGLKFWQISQNHFSAPIPCVSERQCILLEVLGRVFPCCVWFMHTSGFTSSRNPPILSLISSSGVLKEYVIQVLVISCPYFTPLEVQATKIKWNLQRYPNHKTHSTSY